MQSNKCTKNIKENAIVFSHSLGLYNEKCYLLINYSDDPVLDNEKSQAITYEELIARSIQPRPISALRLKVAKIYSKEIERLLSEGVLDECASPSFVSKVEQDLKAILETGTSELDKEGKHQDILKFKRKIEQVIEILENVEYNNDHQRLISIAQNPDSIIKSLQRQLGLADSAIQAIARGDVKLSCGHTLLQIELMQLVHKANNENKGILEVKCAKCEKEIEEAVVKKCIESNSELLNRLYRKEHYRCKKHYKTCYELYPDIDEMICRECRTITKCRICLKDYHPYKCNPTDLSKVFLLCQ